MNTDWILTGADSETKPPRDTDLLRQVLSGVEIGLKKNKLKLKPEKKAELIILLYEHFMETEKDVNEGEVARYLKLVA